MGALSICVRVSLPRRHAHYCDLRSGASSDIATRSFTVLTASLVPTPPFTLGRA
jgi:hypothetical protein